MKTDSFRRWLKGKYGSRAFTKSGRVSKTFVRGHKKGWSKKIRSKAQFFLNTVK